MSIEKYSVFLISKTYRETGSNIAKTVFTIRVCTHCQNRRSDSLLSSLRARLRDNTRKNNRVSGVSTLQTARLTRQTKTTRRRKEGGKMFGVSGGGGGC